MNNAHLFVAQSGDWDQLGRLVGGWAPRNLDEFPVSVDPAGYVAVDLSTIRVGARRP